jgi:hypothetical protein
MTITPIFDSLSLATQHQRVLNVIEKMKHEITGFQWQELQTEIPKKIESNQIYFLFGFESAYLNTVLSNTSVNDRKNIIVIDYFENNALEFLECSKLAGLVHYQAISNWLDNTPAKFMKMGNGNYGLYGKKLLFDSTKYDLTHYRKFSSENYTYFHDASNFNPVTLLTEYMTYL